MAETEAAADGEDVCVVCFKGMDLYSVGACDHPVCYECSTRMRVVCNQRECPICRREMPEVVFTREVMPFKHLAPNIGIIEKAHGIRFMSRSIQDMYLLLLEQVCKICASRFQSFSLLRDHMRKEHELFYCDLCVTNLMIFSFEHKCYTRTQLAIHKRKGDPDNTSHRGHPLCEFCDERYMDNDHLFRHLRRDHLYCHFCDADGKHQYYRSYGELRQHFLEDHYLCEQGNCVNEMLTSVFRTDIDLRAHIATVHSRQLGRAAAKQARTLELEFNFKLRRSHDHGFPDERGAVRSGRRPAPPLPAEVPADVAPSVRRPPTAADFPSLGGGNGETSASAGRASVTFMSKTPRPRFNAEEFPSLGGSGSSTGAVPRNPRKNVPAPQAESSTGSSTLKLTVQPARPIQPANVSVHVSRDGPRPRSSTSIQVRPKSAAEAFPALGGGAARAIPEAAHWVVPKPKQRAEPRASKVAKAPVLPSASLADFPSLGRKTEKKSASVTLPIGGAQRRESKSSNNENNNPQANGACTAAGKKEKSQRKKDDVLNNMGNSNAPKAKDTTACNNSKNRKKGRAESADGADGVSDAGTALIKRTATLNIGTLGQLAAAPPGFDVADNDLTFTNSSGKSYSILPPDSARYSYHQPPNFKNRNAALIQHFISVLKTQQSLDEFKSYSGLFRRGEYPAEKYLEHCQVVLAVDFDQLFPELLVLLPDIDKQQELYHAYVRCNEPRNLEACATCRQVIFVSELKHHLNSHYAESHFPGLRCGAGGPDAWRK